MSAWRFLPEGTHLLAPGERVLWQGRPTTPGLARRFFHVVPVLGYFALLAGWDFVSAHADGTPVAAALTAAAWVAIPALGVATLIYAMAWVLSVTTHYMITDRRIIMQIGIALPIALSLPLRSIGSADLRLNRDGTGDLTVAFSGDDRLAYLLLWPHARPGRFKKAEPMLRSVLNASAVAATLAQALRARAACLDGVPEQSVPAAAVEPAMVAA